MKNIKDVCIDFLKNENIKIITDEMLLSFDTTGKFEKEFDGIAGTMDLFVIDADGNGHIYDFKTVSANTRKKVTPLSLKESYKGKDSNRASWSKQQSVYAQMLEHKTGKPITTSIITFPITYKLDNSYKGSKYCFKSESFYI